MKTPISPRNEIIIVNVLRGYTYRQVGLLFDITGIRVRQIVARTALREGWIGKEDLWRMSRTLRAKKHNLISQLRPEGAKER